jgi:Dynamin family
LLVLAAVDVGRFYFLLTNFFLFHQARKDKIQVEELCTIIASARDTMATEIHKAQDAILKYANGKKFSRNVVCVEIISSDCQDLSLIDLPGLIEAADTTEDEIYIDLILNLVRDYISQKNTSTSNRSKLPCMSW